MSDFIAYAIQNVIAPDFDRPETLYLKDPNAAPKCRGELPWVLSAGHELMTDTYLNSLYLDVWNKYANIGRVGLQVATEGEITVEVLAVQRDQAPIAVAKWVGAGLQTIWLDDVPDDSLRFTFLLRANAEATITQLRWVTDAAPQHTPSLSIGLCTFNREPFLARTVAALVQQRENTPAIDAIYVVNQGAVFSDPALLEDAKLDFVNVLEQPNLGGCGGFTRSMLESITSKPSTTHHILMDDDIILDPRMLDRIALFLGYCEENLALGGQMLEIERPTRLYEAGGRLNPLWFVDPVGHNLEMDQPEGIGLFNEMPHINYNAWWFCVVPTDVIRKIGLPPPLFIRGDDIEYACRMSEAGVATIPLPGCVVWHENFVYKSSDWLLYYDLRNRLILAGLHPDIVAPPDSLYLLGFCMSILLQHRYRATEVSVRAISDAIGDPELILKDGAARHAALMSWQNSLSAPKIYAAEDLPQVEEGQVIPLDPSVWAMVKMSVKGFITLHLSRLRPRRNALRFMHMPEATAVGARDYLTARNPEGSEFTLYKSDLRQLWRLFFKILYVCFRHMLRSQKKAKLYRSKLENMRSSENWRKAFGMKP